MRDQIVLVLPGEPVPVRLMNTIWAGRDGLHDAIGTADELRAWLTAVLPGAMGGCDAIDPSEIKASAHDRPAIHSSDLDPREIDSSDLDPCGLDPHGIDGSDLIRFRRLRDALRQVAGFLTQDSRDDATAVGVDIAAAIAMINAAAAQAPSHPQIYSDRDGLHARTTGPGSAPQRALSVIAAEAIALFTAPDAPLLMACRAPRCVLYFVKDHPRREWCSPGCGNRARVARHYRRNRPTPA